jgi:Fe-S-cluster containining protein
MSVDSLFARHGTRFECRRCGECCGFQVELAPSDVERMSRVDPEVEGRLELSDPCGHLTIRHRGEAEGRSTRCVYLDHRCRCSVYDARPSVCMLYPFFPIPASDISDLGIRMPDDAVSLNLAKTGSKFYVALDPSCPGCGHGSEVDWQEFKETIESRSLED